MPHYRVKDNLNHDAKAYAPGDTVEMPAAQAAPLLAVDVLAPAPKPKGPKSSASAGSQKTAP